MMEMVTVSDSFLTVPKFSASSPFLRFPTIGGGPLKCELIQCTLSFNCCFDDNRYWNQMMNQIMRDKITVD